jgi:hypothetical protein
MDKPVDAARYQGVAALQVLQGLANNVVHNQKCRALDESQQLSVYSDIGLPSHCAACEEFTRTGEVCGTEQSTTSE